MDFGFSGEGGSCEFLNYACELHAKYLHNLFMDFSLGGGRGTNVRFVSIFICFLEHLNVYEYINEWEGIKIELLLKLK